MGVNYKKMIQKYFSDIKKEFTGYNLSKFTQDLLAGITVAAVALPLALAFGVSSGANAAAGLVTAIIGGIIIGLFSGASFQISGPTGAMSAVLIVIVMQYGLQGMLFACFAAGVILLLAGVFKLGGFVNFIPMPVVMGFTSGIALIIALGQVDNFFGTTGSGSGALEKVFSYTRQGFHPNLQATLIGLIVIVVMIVWPKKWNVKVPSSLIGIIVAFVVTAVFKFDNLALVGDIPKTLLLSDRLSLNGVDFVLLKNLGSPIITIAVLGMIESLLCGASASRMKDEKFDADRELIAQGIGNIIIPFFGGVPATAAIARTSVAIKSGEQTRLTGIFHSLFLLLSMFLLGGIMAKLPLAALAGVLMVTAWRMNEWHGIKYLFRKKFKSGISQYLITMAATVVFDLTTAIIIGVIYSAILFVYTSSKITVSFSKVDENDGNAKNNVGVAYINGPLFFGALTKLKTANESMPDCDHLILSLLGVPGIDVSGVQTLLTLCRDMTTRGQNVKFCGVCDKVKAYLDRAGVTEVVGESAFYDNVDQAIMATR
jgi:SulP family sulfate permease